MASLLDMTVRFGADTAQYKRALKKTKSDTDNWAKNITTTLKGLGSVFAGAFAIDSVMQLTRETIQLAMTAEGVANAFKRIGNAKLLDNLRESTKGTVNDFLLMKAAVQASNFDIPLEQMGSLLAFAQRRAIETGQAMDYLVESIVLGIGRKSPLILDNLGISAIRLREEFKGVGVESVSVADVASAVGRIIDIEMKKAGESTLTTNEKFEQQKVKLQNLQLAIGKSLLPTMNAMLEVTNDIGDSLSGIAENESLWDLLAGYAKFMLWAPRLAAKGIGAAASTAKDIFAGADEVMTNANMSAAEFNSMIDHLKGNQKQQTKIIQDQRSEYQKLTDDIELMKTQFDAAWNINQIAEYNKKLKDLEDRLDGIKNAMPHESFNVQKLTSKDIDGGLIVNNPITPGLIEEVSINGDKFNKELKDWQNDLAAQLESVNNMIEGAMADIAATFAEGLGNAIVTGDWKNLFKSILAVVADFMSQLGKALMAMGVAQIVAKKAISSFNGYAMIGAAAALLVAAGALKAVMDKGMDEPRKFASGGIVSSPTLAMVGEYAGANRNPEVIAPLSDLQRILGTGAQVVTVHGKLYGADLLISNERSSYQRSRIRGF